MASGDNGCNRLKWKAGSLEDVVCAGSSWSVPLHEPLSPFIVQSLTTMQDSCEHAFLPFHQDDLKQSERKLLFLDRLA